MAKKAKRGSAFCMLYLYCLSIPIIGDEGERKRRILGWRISG